MNCDGLALVYPHKPPHVWSPALSFFASSPSRHNAHLFPVKVQTRLPETFVEGPFRALVWNLCLSPLTLLYTRNYKLLHFSWSPYKYKGWSYPKTASANYTTWQCWRSSLRVYLHSHLYSSPYVTQLPLARGNLQVQLKPLALTHNLGKWGKTAR